MTDHTVETSPQTLARVAGVLYLIIIVAGVFAEGFVRSKLIVAGDAAATASNIAASQMLWRISVAGELIMHACDVALALILYVLLRPVSRNLALLAAFFDLVAVAIMGVNKLTLLAVLFLLGSGDYLKTFEPGQLHSLAYLSLRLHGYGYSFGLVFFGFACLVFGYLISKSGYFPKILGVLLLVAGSCYLTNSFAMILAPAFAEAMFPAILVPGFIGELSLCLWLIVKGVNLPRWQTQISVQRASWAPMDLVAGG